MTFTVVTLAALSAGACSPRLALESAEVLADLAAGEGPSRLKRTTSEPLRASLDYRVADRQHAADVYRPGEAAEAALVLVPGVARAGKDDPRLVAFAKTLARARFAVLVPDIENLRALNVRPEDARDIADAVRYLAGQVATGDEGSVGLVAISYAAGPALLAALEEEARDRVRFVVAIGGYYDVEAVVTFFTTGFYQDPRDRSWRHLTPNAYGKWVFVHSNADRLSDPGDRLLMTAMADRKLRDLGADVSDLVSRLGAEGRAVHALLENDDPRKTPALITALPEGIRRDMAALDLASKDLSRLGAKLILVHGRDDSIIPYSESHALAAAVPRKRVDLYVVDSLAHVELGATGFGDTLTLLQAIYRLLEERDDAPPIPGLETTFR